MITGLSFHHGAPLGNAVLHHKVTVLHLHPFNNALLTIECSPFFLTETTQAHLSTPTPTLICLALSFSIVKQTQIGRT